MPPRAALVRLGAALAGGVAPRSAKGWPRPLAHAARHCRSVPRGPAPRGSPARASASAARRERTPGLRRAIGTTRRHLRLRVEAAAYCCTWLCAGTWAGGRRRSTLAACASARGAAQRPGAAAIPVGRREGGDAKRPAPRAAVGRREARAIDIRGGSGSGGGAVRAALVACVQSASLGAKGRAA